MADKLVKCPVCGREVSERAEACPGCGDPTAQRYGHSKAVSKPRGFFWWIGLIFVVLLVWQCARLLPSSSSSTAASYDTPAASSPSPAPSYFLKVIDTSCGEKGSYVTAEVTVQNVGTIAIPYAKAFFQFKDEAGQVVGTDDTYFSPTDIPPGSTASADVMKRGIVGATRCGLLTVQDGSGQSVTLQ